MSYNYARFGSVFDFGANYNLTTNDMTLRGFELGRIPDGLFQYLFQFPNIGLRFPYIERVDLLSNYVGQTITEGMYGGVFFTHIFLLVILMIGSVKKQLKNKRIWILASMSYFLAVVIVVADTQMAGLLSRYYYDFLWLLYISSVLVFLQFLEYKNIQIKRKVILLLLIALVCEGFISFCIGIQQGEFSTWCPEIFYKLKAVFDIF